MRPRPPLMPARAPNRQILPLLVVAGAILAAGPTFAAKARKDEPATAKAEAGVGRARAASQRELEVGGGIQAVYPPMLTLQTGWRLPWRLAVSAEAGYLTVPVGTFRGTSTYYGIDGRWTMARDGGLTAGLSLGNRQLTVATVNKITVNDSPYDVTWTRRVDQMLLTPKVGWTFGSSGGHAGWVAAGVAVPLSETFSITRDQETLPGYPPEEMADQERDRADEVKAITSGPRPTLELKYCYRFDVLP